MTHNVPLAEQTLQFILDHPDKHEQGEWLDNHECGTVGCFLGWAVHLECYNNHNQDLKPTTHGGLSVFNYKGEDSHVQYIGTHLLGLNPAESQIIFSGTNTVEDLQDYVKAMANGESIIAVYAEKVRPLGMLVSLDEDGNLNVKYDREVYTDGI